MPIAHATPILLQSVCAIFEKSVKTLLDDFAPMVPQLCEMLGQMYSTIPQASAIDLTRQVRSRAQGWGCCSPGWLGARRASSSVSPSLTLAAGSHLCPRACPLPSHQGPVLARYLSHAHPLPARYVGLTLLGAGAVVRLLHAWSLEASYQEWLFSLLAKLMGPSLILGLIPTPGRWVPSLQGRRSRKAPGDTLDCRDSPASAAGLGVACCKGRAGAPVPLGREAVLPGRSQGSSRGQWCS